MYLDLPEYQFSDMTTNEKKTVISGDIRYPVVIRGMYKPRAIDMKLNNLIELFGNVRIPVEVYNSDKTRTTDALKTHLNLPKFIEYLKNDGYPRFYAADVDIFTKLLNCTEDHQEKIIQSFENTHIETMKEVQCLNMYMGKDHGSDLHLHTNSDTFLNQLFGTKTVYIFDNYENPNIHKITSLNANEDRFNFAKENFFALDHSKMTIHKVTLYPGDTLLIPPWSWHATKGHDLNVSISEVFDRRSCAFLLQNPNLIISWYRTVYDMDLKIFKKYSIAIFIIIIAILVLINKY